mmetsp:Transcript_14717/g.46201  ORF Transcript_14717/g.46201 Transcript_14717/m.46201 type:complete len:433 (-) Transcript_14717:111-1409(-)
MSEKPTKSAKEQLDEALFVSCANGEAEKVRYFLEKGADPSWLAENGRHNALRVSVLRGLFHIVRILHEQGNVSIKDDTLVMHMAALGKVKNRNFLVYLLREGAQLNRVDAKLGTPLMLTLFSDEPDEQFARWLVEEGADVSIHCTEGEQSTALHKCAESASTDLLEFLLQQPGALPLLEARDVTGRTPLIAAAEKGRDATVQMLLTKYKVDPDQRSEDNLTPLFLACQNGHSATAELLVGAGADVNVQDKGDTQAVPLHLAASNSHLSLVKLLLDKGAKVDATESRGFTALMMAGSEGYANVVVTLLQAGANVNAAGLGGETALHIAVRSMQPLIVAILVQAGADLTMKDSEGATAREVAERSDNPIVHNMVNAIDNAAVLVSQEGPERLCAFCFNLLDKPKRCGKCKAIRYCSVECQRSHWPAHKQSCGRT